MSEEVLDVDPTSKGAGFPQGAKQKHPDVIESFCRHLRDACPRVGCRSPVDVEKDLLVDRGVHVPLEVTDSRAGMETIGLQPCPDQDDHFLHLLVRGQRVVRNLELPILRGLVNQDHEVIIDRLRHLRRLHHAQKGFAQAPVALSPSFPLLPHLSRYFSHLYCQWFSCFHEPAPMLCCVQNEYHKNSCLSMAI